MIANVIPGVWMWAKSHSPFQSNVAPAPGPAAPSLEKELERRRRAIEERERAFERVLADFENRMDQLIESIDWTRGDSRLRFPAEVALIRADYDRAVEQLSPAGP